MNSDSPSEIYLLFDFQHNTGHLGFSPFIQTISYTTMTNDSFSQDLNTGYDELLKRLSKSNSPISGIALTFNKITKEIELHPIVKVNSKYLTVDTPLWTSGSGHDRTFTQSNPTHCMELFRVMIDFNTKEISEKISQIKELHDIPSDERLIYSILKKEPNLGLSNIVDKFKNGTTHRDVISKILQNMVKDGKLEKTKGHKGLYSLTYKFEKYFDLLSEKN